MFEFLKSKSSSRRERNGVAAFEECGNEEPFSGNAASLNCTFRLYSCGFKRPRRSLQCDFGPCKVNPKTHISTSFWALSQDFSEICRILPGFAPIHGIAGAM